MGGDVGTRRGGIRGRGLEFGDLGNKPQRKCCVSRGTGSSDRLYLRPADGFVRAVRTITWGSTEGTASVARDQSAVLVWLCAGLTGAKLTLLSGGGATSRTADRKYLLRAEFFFHHAPPL
jgi:hypothetical protein